MLFYYIYRNENFINYLIQIGISYIFLDLSFHKVDFKLFINAFRLIDIRIFILIVIVYFISTYFRAFKWSYLFHHIKKVKIVSLFKTTLVGFMVNSIYPARIGEIYRAYMLSRLEKINKSTILGTIVLERLFDGVVVGLGIIYIFLLNIIHNKVFYKVGLLGIIVYFAAICSILLFYFRKVFIIKLINILLFFLKKKVKKKIFNLLDSFYHGLHILKNLPNLLMFTLYTIITWVIIVFSMYLYIQSMNIFQIISVPINPFIFSLLLTGMLAIGVSIPSGPGAVGPFQASILFTFFLINKNFMKSNSYEYNVIASFSMYMWLSQVMLQIISGVFVLFKEKIKIKAG